MAGARRRSRMGVGLAGGGSVSSAAEWKESLGESVKAATAGEATKRTRACCARIGRRLKQSQWRRQQTHIHPIALNSDPSAPSPMNT